MATQLITNKQLVSNNQMDAATRLMSLDEEPAIVFETRDHIGQLDLEFHRSKLAHAINCGSTWAERITMSIVLVLMVIVYQFLY